MQFFRRYFAWGLIILSVIGMLFSVYALVQIWRFRAPVSSNLYDGLVFAEKIVDTTSTSLDVIDSSLTNAGTSLTILEESTTLMTQSMEDTSVLLDSFSELFEGEFKDTMEKTRISVVSAQSSALVIDNLLYGLSNVPLLGIRYNPPKPLNVALKDIGVSLEYLPKSMDKIAGNLTESNENLRSLQSEIGTISTSLKRFQKDLTAAQSVVGDYQSIMLEIKNSLSNAQQKMPVWSIWAAIYLSFAVISIGVAQFGAMLQGFDMLQKQRYLSSVQKEALIEEKLDNETTSDDVVETPENVEESIQQNEEITD